MSLRSDRKWAAKEATAEVREDARTPRPVKRGPRPGFQRGPDLGALSKKANDLGAHARDQHAKMFANTRTLAERQAGTPEQHHEAAEKAHFEAGMAHKKAGNLDKAREHFTASSEHGAASRGHWSIDPTKAGTGQAGLVSQSAKATEQLKDVAKQQAADRAAKGEQLRQKSVGEAHLAAAAIHEQAAKSFEKLESSKGEGVRLSFKNAAADHRQQAAQHKYEAGHAAKAAGGEWDESKHPCDENGKFA